MASPPWTYEQALALTMLESAVAVCDTDDHWRLDRGPEFAAHRHALDKAGVACLSVGVPLATVERVKQGYDWR